MRRNVAITTAYGMIKKRINRRVELIYFTESELQMHNELLKIQGCGSVFLSMLDIERLTSGFHFTFLFMLTLSLWSSAHF